MRIRRRHRQHGFTLIEVMVALIIAALGLTAVAVSLQQHTDNARRLRDRTLAMYVASNAITELRLNAAFPDVGRTTDEVDFANRRWQIVTEITESGVEGLRRADITISGADTPDITIRSALGFVSNRQPLPSSALPTFADLGDPAGEIR